MSRFHALLGLAVLIPLLAGAEEAKKPASVPPQGAEEVEITDPKLKKAIDDCLQRGVNWLKGRQESTGAWPGLLPGPLYPGSTGTPYDHKFGLTALALLALLKCGVPATDPCITKGFSFLRIDDSQNQPGVRKSLPSERTYDAGILLMVLEAKYAPKEAVGRKEGRKAAKPKPVQVGKQDAAWVKALANSLVALQRANGGWRYDAQPPPTDMEGGKSGVADVSNTQYALMGLKLARRMGIPVKPEVFARAADFLMNQQEAAGPAAVRITRRKEGETATVEAVGYSQDKARGFPYMKGAANQHDAHASGAMTCAGLVGMMICRSEMIEDQTLKDKAKRLAKVEQAIWDGLAWLDAHWTVSANPPAGNHELGYYLYALERVGIMADLRMVGPGHDWYEQGARVLTDRITEQGKDEGYWAISQARQKPETQDTPYALLFLRKASIKVGYPIE